MIRAELESVKQFFLLAKKQIRVYLAAEQLSFDLILPIVHVFWSDW